MHKIELSEVLSQSLAQNKTTDAKSVENLYKLIVAIRALQKNIDADKANLELAINKDLAFYGKCDPCMLQKYKSFENCNESEVQDEIENDVRATQQTTLTNLKSDIKKMKLFSMPQYIVENVSCNDILNDLMSNKLIDKKMYFSNSQNNTHLTDENKEYSDGNELDFSSDDTSPAESSDSNLDRILEEQFKKESIDINSISSSEDASENDDFSSDENKQSSASELDEEVSLDDEILDELYK